MGDVQSWARTFNGRERKCKFLINLGLFGHFDDRRQTSDGAEEHFKCAARAARRSGASDAPPSSLPGDARPRL